MHWFYISSLLLLAVSSYSHAYSGPMMHSSQRIDPMSYDCKNFLDKTIRSGELLAAPDQALEFEHCFRLQQMARLASQRITGGVPEFYVERVPRIKLPKGATTDVPILRVVFPQRIFFDTDKHTLRPEAKEVVDIIVSSLKKDAPDVTLFIAGHTDPRGSADYNYNLSIDRAYAVAKTVFENGGLQKNIWWIGFGRDMPLVPNTGPEAWGYNRRVEFLFSGTPAAIAVWMADMQIDRLCASNSKYEEDKCKLNLDLKRIYDAVEITQAKEIVNSNDNAAIEIGSDKRSLNPVPGRRFSIDPTRRTATAIQK